ncbi:hypothetical protein GCM10028775_40810 [Catellatospora paridis]
MSVSAYRLRTVSHSGEMQKRMSAASLTPKRIWLNALVLSAYAESLDAPHTVLVGSIPVQPCTAFLTSERGRAPGGPYRGRVCDRSPVRPATGLTWCRVGASA